MIEESFELDIILPLSPELRLVPAQVCVAEKSAIARLVIRALTSTFGLHSHDDLAIAFKNPHAVRPFSMNFPSIVYIVQPRDIQDNITKS